MILNLAQISADDGPVDMVFDRSERKGGRHSFDFHVSTETTLVLTAVALGDQTDTLSSLSPMVTNLLL